MDDREELGRRIFLAHLEIERRLGKRVSYEELGRLVAEHEEPKRPTPYTYGNVYRWEKGMKEPSRPALKALAGLSGFTAGWLTYGEGAQYPEPRDVDAIPQVPREAYVPAPTAPADTRRPAKRAAKEKSKGKAATKKRPASRPAARESHPRKER